MEAQCVFEVLDLVHSSAIQDLKGVKFFLPPLESLSMHENQLWNFLVYTVALLNWSDNFY